MVFLSDVCNAATALFSIAEQDELVDGAGEAGGVGVTDAFRRFRRVPTGTEDVVGSVDTEKSSNAD